MSAEAWFLNFFADARHAGAIFVIGGILFGILGEIVSNEEWVNGAKWVVGTGTIGIGIGGVARAIQS
jgi:hypothetical protein